MEIERLQAALEQARARETEAARQLAVARRTVAGEAPPGAGKSSLVESLRVLF